MEYIGGSGPRRFLQAAARRHAPAARRVRRRRRLEPGATAQKLHADGPPSSSGLYTVFVPLVDVPKDGDGTAFWPGSHASPSCLRAAAAFNAARFRGSASRLRELVAPGVARGSLLAFDYRVLHAGNPCARHRPVAYLPSSTRATTPWARRVNWAPERCRPRGSVLLLICGRGDGVDAHWVLVGGARGAEDDTAFFELATALPSSLITHTSNKTTKRGVTH